MPKISVLMSVYNNEDYLEKSIESILNQTYKNFEFIITDDCSKDNSANIIKYYADKDDRIKFIQNQKNIGLTKSLNNMIDIAKGEYIARMDGDDVALNTRFKDQIKVFDENKRIDIVFSNVFLIDEKGQYICPSYRPNNIKKIIDLVHIINYIPHPTVMIKKKVFIKYGRYNTDFKRGQDKELWQRLINKDVHFFYKNKVLLLYRIHSNNVSKGKQGKSESYKLANICISNKSKIEGLKYFSLLTIKEKIIYLIKLIVPHKILFLKGFLLRKWRYKVKGR